MRLYRYLLDLRESTIIRAKPAEVNAARKKLAKREKIQAADLEYRGSEDAGPKFGIIHYFNIEDKNHPRYGSTVIYRKR